MEFQALTFFLDLSSVHAYIEIAALGVRACVCLLGLLNLAVWSLVEQRFVESVCFQLFELIRLFHFNSLNVIG